MAKTLDNIIEQVARNIGNTTTGIVKGGDTTYISDPTYLLQPDGHWINHYIRINDTYGEERLITDHVGSQLTFAPALASTQPSSGMTYTLLPLQRVEFIAAIEQAINMAGSAWAVIKDDDSTVFTVEQEYALPSDLVALWDVYGGDGVYWQPLTNWEIIGSPGGYKLLFKKLPELRIPLLPTQVPVIQMRFIYVGLPTLLSGSSDTLGVGDVAERQLVQYVIEYASHILHRQAMRRNLTGEAARGHMSAAEEHRRAADRIKEDRDRVPVIRRVKTRDFPRVLG